jgi:hypothetical protein
VSNFLELTIFGLATYRLTRLINRDEIFAPLRNKFWKKFPPEKSHLGYLLTCTWCVSIWSASLIEISRIIIPNITRSVAIVLTLSAITGLVTAYENK